MPKISRTRRQREREIAANLHRQKTDKSHKVATTAAYRKGLIRRIADYSLIGVGAAMGTAHVIEHLGVVQVLPNAGLQDLLLGYPMAGLLIIADIVMVSR